jgi:predicted glutamine amidotransferase
MCGILGVYIKDNTNNAVFSNLYEIYRSQKHRGQNGAGVAVKSGGTIRRLREKDPERLFSIKHNKFWQRIKAGDYVMIHHRKPTCGIDGHRIKSNHPFYSMDHKLCLIHNGTVSNVVHAYKNLMQKNKGFTFESEVETKEGIEITDSELLVHFLSTKDTITAGFNELNNNVIGSITVAVMKKGLKGIYLHRNNRTLTTFTDRLGNIYFASEMPNSFKKLRQIHEHRIYRLDDKGIRLVARTKKGKEKEQIEAAKKELKARNKKAKERQERDSYEFEVDADIRDYNVPNTPDDAPLDIVRFKEHDLVLWRGAWWKQEGKRWRYIGMDSEKDTFLENRKKIRAIAKFAKKKKKRVKISAMISDTHVNLMNAKIRQAGKFGMILDDRRHAGSINYDDVKKIELVDKLNKKYKDKILGIFRR